MHANATSVGRDEMEIGLELDLVDPADVDELLDARDEATLTRSDDANITERRSRALLRDPDRRRRERAIRQRRVANVELYAALSIFGGLERDHPGAAPAVEDEQVARGGLVFELARLDRQRQLVREAREREPCRRCFDRRARGVSLRRCRGRA